MSISERFKESCRFVTYKILWVILIPILLDLAMLFSWQNIFHSIYKPVQKLFVIKLGFIGVPPSVKFLLEDFPTPLLQYNSDGFSGVINQLSIFNVALLITIMLVTSFFESGYMSIIGTRFHEKVKVSEFFIGANKRWYKFFLLNCISWIPMLLMLYEKGFILLSFASVIFVYVKYSFVTDEVSIVENFMLGVVFLFENFLLTLKMVVYFGFIFSLISIVVFQFAKLGIIGIIIDIVICAYFGTCVNRTIMDIYSILAGGK